MAPVRWSARSTNRMPDPTNHPNTLDTRTNYPRLPPANPMHATMCPVTQPSPGLAGQGHPDQQGPGLITILARSFGLYYRVFIGLYKVGSGVEGW